MQPLNHDLIPNLEKNVWKVYQNPFYDQGWTYTIPYVTWTTGIGYRRDHISDDEMAAKGYDILWDPQYYGKTAFYDDYRTALGMALLRNGVKTSTPGTRRTSRRQPTRSSRCSMRRTRASRSTTRTCSFPRTTSGSPKRGQETWWGRSTTCRKA